jgi:hypothetical protein
MGNSHKNLLLRNHWANCSLYSSNFCTFWLKIEQFWPFEEISIFSHGGHLGSILSQKVQKFELYKHNDELFNIYYGIFYEL